MLLEKEAIKLCPELKDLSDKEVLFVILSQDYKSPFHQMPQEDRVRRAARQAFGNEKYDVSAENIQTAINAYNSLQFDHRREMIKRYQSKISFLSQVLAEETSAKKISDIDNAIAMLSDRCKKVQYEIDKDEEYLELKGGGELSFLETWQRNKRNWQEDQQYRKERTGVEEIG